MLYVPVGQGMHDKLLNLAAYVPGSHSEHVTLPNSVENFPAAQVMHVLDFTTELYLPFMQGKQAVAPIALVKAPLGQNMQEAISDADTLGLYVPFSQYTHPAVGNIEPVEVPYVPDGQAWQLVFPNKLLYLPEGHIMQDVAELWLPYDPRGQRVHTDDEMALL